MNPWRYLKAFLAGSQDVTSRFSAGIPPSLRIKLRRGGRLTLGMTSILAPSAPKRIPAMGAAAADGTFPPGDDFRLKQDGVEIGKVLQLQPRNFLTDEMFNRL